MIFPHNYPNIEEHLQKQGLSTNSIELTLALIAIVCLGEKKKSDTLMVQIANGFLSFKQKLDEFSLTPEGMAFENWAKENPLEAIKAIKNSIEIEEMLKNINKN